MLVWFSRGNEGGLRIVVEGLLPLGGGLDWGMSVSGEDEVKGSDAWSQLGLLLSSSSRFLLSPKSPLG